MAWAASAQTLELISLINLWKYEQSGGDLGTAWKEPGYDDSAWPAGRGVLAFEPESQSVQVLTNTVLTRWGTNGVEIITYYFRTHFNVGSVQPGWFLLASNLVDDGAVFYLNGVELFRQNMPTGLVHASTLALEWIDSGREGIFVVTDVSAAALQPGDNQLAVEVHQPYYSSSDVTFGMVLSYGPQVMLKITSQPPDLMVAERQRTNLTVGVAGSVPRYQWFRDDVPLAGATEPVLAFPLTARSDAGQYFLVASNDVSVVTSRVATLTIALDVEGPVLQSARQPPGSGRVQVHFSEAVDSESMQDPANYQLAARDGTPVAVTNAMRTGTTTVSLGARPLVPGMNHILTVRNVRDLSGNVIASDARIDVATTVALFPVASSWRYNDSGSNLGNAWSEPGYDDSGWPVGQAVLYNDVNLSLDPPGTRQTLVSVTNLNGPIVTHYFRHHFTNTASPLGASLRLRYYVDDGAIFYLNGREFWRVGMPAGIVDYRTRAVDSAVEGLYHTNTIGFLATNLVGGGNVFAAEVHQYSLTSPNWPDISFGLQLEADVESFTDVPALFLSQPRDATVPENGTAVFSARVVGAESLQWLRDGAVLAGVNTDTYTIAAAGLSEQGAGFSLVASNALGMVTSRVGRLRVVPDVTSPRLLSAQMGTNTNRMLLTFSEPVDVGSASDAARYAITNQHGQNLDIFDATVTNRTNVVLATGSRVPGDVYVASATGVKDLFAGGNPAGSNGALRVDYEALLLPYSWVWRYNDHGTNAGPGWFERDFDDSQWPLGPGLLGFDESTLPVPIETRLTYGWPTYYFRTQFMFADDPAEAILRLRSLVDDGAVLYLNGQEVFRLRVPPGQNHETLATPFGKVTAPEGSFMVSTAALRQGRNVLAAEVHQNTRVSEDLVFGVELVQAFPGETASPGRPQLQFERAGEQLILWWAEPDFVLENAEALDGIWRPTTSPTLPYPVTPVGGSKFFRLRQGFR